MNNQQQWEISLCQFGECSSCCYSCCCSTLATSEARSLVDGSQCIFNYYCLNGVVNRWLIRTAYGIEGNACYDCLIGSFCCLCSANQMYQTAYKRGNPVKPTGGFHNNEGTWQAPSSCALGNCCYATFCPCCAVGTALQRSVGMNWWLGCCCVCPCAASQLVRYQYRIKGSDVGGDMVAPYTLYLIAQALSCFGPLSFVCLFGLLYPYTLGKITSALSESEARGGGEGAQYLVSYIPVGSDQAAGGPPNYGRPAPLVYAEVSPAPASAPDLPRLTQVAAVKS